MRQHQRIVRALAEQDPAAAEEAVIEHLPYLREHLLAYQQR
ncbi:FCD domain-containing protein [Blastococcus sp. SYSU DS0753]